MRNQITFLCNEQERHASVPPTTTVLEWLRGEAGLRGTKEGCAEGDCGACTVILGEPDGEAMRYRPVNACILFVPALDGRQLLTVEHLASDGTPHPVQRAMVERHASQCGFCTPGFVMSLFALHHQSEPADRAEACEALAGNLCRCTGYRPIVDAVIESCAAPAADRFAERASATAARLRALPESSLDLAQGDARFAAPRTLAEALRLRAERPDALLLAGGTDVGLLVTKQRRALPDVVALDRVAELGRLDADAAFLRIGAAVFYEDALPAIAADWPEFGGMMRRLGSRQIRHRGTIGGNLGTASPIGDMAPALIALAASVVVASVRGERTIPLDEFFVGYRKTAMGSDELIARIEIPRPAEGDILRVYKVSKRAEEDISSVCAAFRLRLRDGHVVSLRAAFGGVAATPLRATALEAAVAGAPWNEATVARGIAALDAAIAPIDDARASARYRRLVAGNLLRRLWLETQGGAGAGAAAGAGRMNELLPIAPHTSVAGRAMAHDSAERHVAGTALYIDDLPEPRDLLHAYIALSPHAHARIVSMDLSAVAAAPGVVVVLAAGDVPGVNDVGPALPGDPIFADGLVEYHGQSLFAVAADSIPLACAAAKLARIEYDMLPPVITVDDAMDQSLFVLPSQVMARGDADAALSAAPNRLSGRARCGGQEHFYLEGQVAMAIPAEDLLTVHSSTQHPTEVQHLVARALALPDNAVVCECRRMGGGFGGKESQASLIAVVAALLAVRTGRPVKLRVDRDDDMILTGKRHDFRIDWDVGFDDTGRIEGVTLELAARCGMSPDLSLGINDRAMFHADNAYYLPNVRIVSHRCKTNTVSNTAFRGFGGPQGMFGIEAVMDAIARHLDLDPLLVRRRNFYGTADRNVTPYHMTVEDNVIDPIVDELLETSSYHQRRAGIAAFNADSPVIKRGIALTPVKFGISFTLIHLNQAGALVHVYTDGSVMLSHGGTEMGQGLYVKVAQVVAETFGLALDRVRITATNTSKVPNTSPTAASSGSDLNGKAAQNGALQIRERMAEVAADVFGVPADEVAFADGEVRGGGRSMTFAALAKRCHLARVQLWAAGFYATPKIHYDREHHRGRPFYYFAYGASVSEVEIDTLTGEYRILRVDILHDAGRSLNPAIDMGQVEGGFVQGVGWLTTEELWWDKQGHLRTHAPSTYKIPVAGDVPEDFRVTLWAGGVNREDAIFRSKAVGEPPLMHGLSVFFALRDAAANAAGAAAAAALDAPATPERVLLAITP